MGLLFRNKREFFQLLIDLLIVSGALLFAYLLRFNFEIPSFHLAKLLYVLPVLLLVRSISFFAFKTLHSVIKYTGVNDVLNMFYSILAGSIVLATINLLGNMVAGEYLIPFSILIMETIFSLVFLMAFRMILKVNHSLHINAKASNRKNVVIFGAGEAGLTTKIALEREKDIFYNILGFIDDSKKYKSKTVQGIPIYPSEEALEDLNRASGVDLMIIAVMNLDAQRKNELIQAGFKQDIEVQHLPAVANWINGELSAKQIRQIKIDDLLQRDEIKLDTNIIRKEIYNKVVLVSGAAGSIGSEIVRQLIKFNPEKIVLLDQAETPLYEIDLEVKESLGFKKIASVMGDVRNKDRMLNVFKSFKPDIVFHAAAYKHVPMMEENPSEALLANLHGTRVMSDLACEQGVDKFVLISTDKAVNPSSIMGASKRAAEIYVQSLNQIDQGCKTKFITTRFGNVLGSNGSVIKRFKKQIDEGGPVTVTHPEITRFFMTIPEACQLVLEAGTMGVGGEIFVFDMGKPIKILDLAKNMIRLSGLDLGKDIEIEFTGLRPGEKLYEEVLHMSENVKPTHNPKIQIAQVKHYDHHLAKELINSIIGKCYEQDNFGIVAELKNLIPEFKSQNSVYQALDEETA